MLILERVNRLITAVRKAIALAEAIEQYYDFHNRNMPKGIEARLKAFNEVIEKISKEEIQ